MRKTRLYVVLALFILSGCAITAEKEDDLTLGVLNSPPISFAEQKKSKDQIIADLTFALEKERLAKMNLEKILLKREKKIKVLTEALRGKGNKRIDSQKIKDYYSFVILVQTYLKNAGFDPGFIDGKMGSRTRDALVKFQKANDLPAEGRVNRQTWELLCNYN